MSFDEAQLFRAIGNVITHSKDWDGGREERGGRTMNSALQSFQNNQNIEANKLSE